MSTSSDVNKQVAWLDGRLEHLVRSDETVGRLCSAPSVGPVTAAVFASTIDEPDRFRGAHQMEAYLGLERHYQSGQRTPALSARAGGALDPAIAQPAHRGAQGLGRADRRAPGFVCSSTWTNGLAVGASFAREGTCAAGRAESMHIHVTAHRKLQAFARSAGVAPRGRGIVWLGGGSTPPSTQSASASIAARTQGSMGRRTVSPYASMPAWSS